MIPKELAVKISNVSKHYVAGNIQALNNVSLEVHKGDFIGIVGKNGCGKSTLLKIIAGILKPTTGEVKVFGSILALTDIGAGFHPDLSGRENIYMIGHLSGLKNNVIDNLLPEILAFSELGSFIELPVKNYSQGMFLRLAFSIMVSMPTEIVLFDEILSVGDAAFQQKCFEKIRQMIEKGLTVIMVSHTFEEIAALSNKCIVMYKGEIVASGHPEFVYNQYMDTLNIPLDIYEISENRIGNHLKVIKSGYIKIIKVKIESNESPEKKIEFSDSICISVEWEKQSIKGGVFFQFTISDKLNRPVLSTANFYGRDVEKEKALNNNQTGIFISKCIVPPYFMNHGIFHLGIYSTLFLGNGNYFTILETIIPIRFFIANSKDFDEKFYWIESLAPVRTQLEWSDYKI